MSYVRFICTNKGTHRPTEVGPVAHFCDGINYYYDNGHEKPAVLWHSYEEWREDHDPHHRRSRRRDPALKEQYRFSCKRCSRTPQLSKANLVKLLDACRDTNTPVDLSYLPF